MKKGITDLFKNKDSFQFKEVTYRVLNEIEEEYGLKAWFQALEFIFAYEIFGKDILNMIKEKEFFDNNGYNRNSNIGYVYIIKLDGYYKIGRTSNPSNRFGEYTKLMKEPEVISLIFCDNYKQVEKELHEMFSDKNTNGEWFTLSDEELDKAIQYLKEKEFIKNINYS